VKLKIKQSLQISTKFVHWWNNKIHVHMNHHVLDLRGITILLPIIKFVIGNYIEMPKILKTFKGDLKIFNFVKLWILQLCGLIILAYKVWLKNFLNKSYNLWKDIVDAIFHLSIKCRLTFTLMSFNVWETNW
jgi:hypothetical protein